MVDSDKRLSDMLWQSKLILDDKILLQDFIYILQFTDSVEQQQTQLGRVKRYIKKMKAKQKRDELQQREINDDFLEQKIQMEEDEELLMEVAKSNLKRCFCFKQKVSKDLRDRVRDRLLNTQANSKNDFKL